MLEAKILSPITALWERKRPLMLDRLTVLDRAAQQFERGFLPPTLLEEAVAEAHKLAGSLGTFGFPLGTEIAREIELGLEQGTLDPQHLLTLTRQLRQAIFPAIPVE